MSLIPFAPFFTADFLAPFFALLAWFKDPAGNILSVLEATT